MLNYIKSEFYRITHSNTLCIVGCCFAAMPLLINIILYCFALYDPGFPYATTSYSYSNIVASPMLFSVAALFLVYTLYEGNKKSGTTKNIVASGVSREKIFVGQIIVCLVVAVFLLVITVSVYIVSARFLLKLEGPVTEMDMIVESLVMAPIAVAALIVSIVVVTYFDKSSVGIFYWFCIFFFIPQVFFYIGLVIDPVMELAMWMPNNFFRGMQVNMSVCIPVWDTPSGLMRCLISGFIGIAIFATVGLFGLRKKEF